MPIAVEHIKTLTAHTAAIVSHHEAIEAVLATVQPEVQRLNALREQETAARELVFDKIFAEATLEDLFEPVHAGILYSLGWNKGAGAAGFSPFWERSVEGTYISSYSRWSVDENSDDDAVKEPEIALPIELDEAMLERTVAVLEPLYATAHKLRPEVTITVRADPRGYSLRPQGTTWELLFRGKVQSTYDTLLAVLRQIPSVTF